MQSAWEVKTGRPGRKADIWATTSIFDPVLCEIAYRWFCPEGGRVLDPFAGGSVRGIVAGRLGCQYVGVDLSKAQVEANRQRARDIETVTAPEWIVGDSRNLAVIAKGQYDLVFSCPPYFDLERYTDDKSDLSNLQSYDAFLADYRDIVAQAVGMLNADRFACFVVGDIRDRKGFYRNFVANTVQAFLDAGMQLYNEAMLITMPATLTIRAGKQFSVSRKLGKSHQNVLVFFRGDPNSIREHFPAQIEAGEEGEKK